MKKFIIIFTALLTALTACSTGRFSDPYSYAGVLDLRNYEFNESHTIPVQGEWEIYRGRLLEPSDFTNAANGSEEFADASIQWKNIYVNGERLSGDGCNTFRLTLLLPETNRTYGLSIPDINSAYTLFINGVEAGHSGIVADNKQDFFPHVVHKNFYFNAPGEKAEFVLQMANYGSHSGGCSGIISLGADATIQLHQRLDDWQTYFVIGALFIIAIYNIVLFITMNKLLAPFLFGLFSVLMILLFMIKTSGPVPTLFPGVNSFFLLRLDFIILFLIMPLYNSMIYMLYKQHVSLIVIIIANVVALILLIPGIFVPLDLMSVIGSIYRAMIFVTAVYLIVAMIRSYRSCVKKALYLIVGSIFLFATAFNHFLYSSRIINTYALTSLGVFVLLLCEALMLTQIFAETYLLSESLTTELKKKNDQLNEFAEQLEQKVLERTEELKKAQNRSSCRRNRFIGQAHRRHRTRDQESPELRQQLRPAFR
jgi:hypothetical protein